jgi:hypothetical protein
MGLLNKNGVWQHIPTIFFLWRFHVGLHTKTTENNELSAEVEAGDNLLPTDFLCKICTKLGMGYVLK